MCTKYRIVVTNKHAEKTQELHNPPASTQLSRDNNVSVGQNDFGSVTVMHILYTVLSIYRTLNIEPQKVNCYCNLLSIHCEESTKN